MIRTNKTIAGAIACAMALLAITTSCSALTEKANPDWDTFEPTTYKGKLGTVLLPGTPYNTLTLREIKNGQLGDYLQVNVSQQLSKDVNAKSLKVPVGTYQFIYCSAKLPVKNGTILGVFVKADPKGKAKPIVIKPNKAIRLSLLDAAMSKVKSGKMGTITLPYDESAMVVLADADGKRFAGYLQAWSESNTMTVPVGKYRVTYLSAVETGENGIKWSIISNSYSNSNRAGISIIEVKPNSDVQVPLQEPLIASIEVKQKGSDVDLSLQLTTENGNSCMIKPLSDGVEKHGFEVLSESGEVLMSDKFKFG